MPRSNALARMIDRLKLATTQTRDELLKNLTADQLLELAKKFKGIFRQELLLLSAEREKAYPVRQKKEKIESKNEIAIESSPSSPLGAVHAQLDTILQSRLSTPLNPIEAAKNMKWAIELGMSEDEVANRLRRNKHYVSSTVALLAMPQSVLNEVRSGALAATLAWKWWRESGENEKIMLKRVLDAKKIAMHTTESGQSVRIMPKHDRRHHRLKSKLLKKPEVVSYSDYREVGFVSYSEFRQLMKNGKMALLYELNFEHRQQGRDVPVVTERLVQTTWREVGYVQRKIYDYAIICIPEIDQMQKMPRINWSLATDKAMLKLVRETKSNFLKAAHQLRIEQKVMVSIGNIKGRLYNILANRSYTQLSEDGFTKDEVDFLKSRSKAIVQRRRAAA